MPVPKTTTSLDLIHILLHYSANLGLDPDDVMGAAGFTITDADLANHRIPSERLIPLWQQVVRQSADDNFGLHLGEASQKYANGGILLPVMMNCAALEGALQALTRYHNLATDYVQIKLLQDDDHAVLIWETADEAIPAERHFTEMVCCNLFFMLRRLTQDTVRPCEVHFRHARPEDAAEHHRIFDCHLVFDQPQNELTLRREDLKYPIFLANPDLLNKMEQLAEEMLERLYPPDSWAGKVSRLIEKSLLDGEKPVLQELAKGLALSPRQIQSNLKEEGLSFQDILDERRQERAQKYLADARLSVCDVAFLLGYSEQSTFNHAFKRWTGLTPGEFRLRQIKEKMA